MNKIGLAKLIILCFSCSESAGKLYLEEYSWRDFEGIVPSDAFSAGLDKHGKQIYIGQALYENKLIPGKIYSNDDNVYFEWGSKERTSKNNVKILCTKAPGNFKWIQTNKDKVSDLVDTILIKGGFEPQYFTFLGRVFVNSSFNVGKVICGDTTCLAMYTTDDGVGKTYGEFQVLTYSSRPQMNVVDYFWRDYESAIPDDALPGGLDQAGGVIYIGQVLYEDMLIPGKIYENDMNIYFEYQQKALQTNENIKIFCSKTPNAFEWLLTNSTEILKLTKKDLMNGGYEPNSITYIGRVYAGGETSVGKVTCLTSECHGLYVAKDGKGLLFNKSFEVLTRKLQ